MRIFKNSFIIASLLSLCSCTSTIVYKNQEIPASVNISREKDTVVVLHFRNDDYRIAKNLDEKLKDKGFKTMPSEMYYEYKDTLMQKTNFVTLKGIVKGHVSKPRVSKTFAETCAADAWGKPIRLHVFTEDLTARLNVSLTFSGIGDRPYSTDLEGFSSDQVQWSQCGPTPPPHFIPPRAESKPAITRARNVISAEFEKLIDGYSIAIPVTLFKADKKLIPAMEAGNFQFAAGNLTQAANEYKRAIHQAKSNPQAKPADLANCYYNLGITQGYLGDEAGFANLDKAVSLNQNQKYLRNRNVMNRYFTINKDLNN